MTKQLQMRLKQARGELGWSQKDVAERIGTDPKTVSRWERGVAYPAPYFRQKLADLFQKSLRELELVGMSGAAENAASWLRHQREQDAPPCTPREPILEPVLEVYETAEYELLILGEPGNGKSRLLLHLALTLVDQSALDQALYKQRPKHSSTST